MRESGPRKRDEDGDDDGDVDEDNHRGDDSALDGTPVPPRERRRGSLPCASSSMASPLDGEMFPLWCLAFMVMMAPLRSFPMAFGDDGPLRQGAGTSLDWVSVATEASGGGTPDLGYFLEVSVFIGILAPVSHQEVPDSPTRQAHMPGGAPPPSWTARDSCGPTLLLRGLLLVHKKSSKLARQLDSVWYSFSVKLKNKEKTETGTGL